jgi:hypothetical protein
LEIENINKINKSRGIKKDYSKHEQLFLYAFDDE